MVSSKRNKLALKQNVELIQNSSNQSHRQLAEKFNSGSNRRYPPYVVSVKTTHLILL